MKVSKFIILLVFLMALTTSSHAETTVTPEVGFVLNTLLFLMEDFLLCGWLREFACGGLAVYVSIFRESF